MRYEVRGVRYALLACCLFAVLPGSAQLPPPVEAALQRAGVPISAVSAVVEPVDGGTPLVSHRASVAMNPASVAKILTSYAALDVLGPAFTFRTDFLLRGELVNGVLDGDLVIRGRGDPKLTYERLWQAAHELRARGLREVRGDVVVDRGYFAPVTHDPARFDNDARRAYNVGADAFLVNFNAVNFKFVPFGDSVRVVGEPDLPNVEIASQIKLVSEPCLSWRRDLKHEIVEKGLIASVLVSGTFPRSCGERAWPLSVFMDPARFSESVFRWVWSESGGVLRGRMRGGSVPADAVLFYRHESEPLASLVRDMNKYSNNVMARHLFLAISAENGAGPGETKATERVIGQWLKAKGIVAPELVTDNGSGLSREGRMSAATIAALLRSAWASGVMPEMMASFPVLAVDGTLKLRRPSSAAARAHLKGGTLDGVQTQAGYVLDARSRRWIVVMMINHPKANAAQEALDALTEWVHARSP